MPLFGGPLLFSDELPKSYARTHYSGAVTRIDFKDQLTLQVHRYVSWFLVNQSWTSKLRSLHHPMNFFLGAHHCVSDEITKVVCTYEPTTLVLLPGWTSKNNSLYKMKRYASWFLVNQSWTWKLCGMYRPMNIFEAKALTAICYIHIQLGYWCNY